MSDLLMLSLLITNLGGLVVLIIMTLYMRQLMKELPKYRATTVVVQQMAEVVAIVDATVLTGGAVKFESEEIGSVVVDFDGRGPFVKIPGEELVVTFQKRRRVLQ